MANISEGARVELVNMTTKDLEGLKGVVLGNATPGRVAVKLNSSKRIVAVKKANLREIKSNWTNLKNTFGTRRTSMYAFGSRRKNSLKGKTVKQLKAILSAKGISSSGMTNRRNLEDALENPVAENPNVAIAIRRLRAMNNNNASRRRLRNQRQGAAAAILKGEELGALDAV